MNELNFGTPYLNRDDKKNLIKAFDTNWISQGKYNFKFEKLFKNIYKTKHALSVCNGTKGIMLAIMALKLKPNDEILVPEYCYISPINICKILNLKIKPVKINYENLQIDVEDLEKKISKKTKCILLVHNYGNVGDISKIISLSKKYKVKVIEDFSESTFSRLNNKYVGTFGDISVSSLHATKTITTGEGGIVLTKNTNLFKQMYKIREHGYKRKGDYSFEITGSNFKLSNLLASIGYSQLKRYKEIVNNKKKIFNLYFKNLRQLPKIDIPKFNNNEKPCMWCFPIIIKNQNSYQKFVKFLKMNNIAFKTGFKLLYQYKHLKINRLNKKNPNVILLPMNVNLKVNQALKITDVIKMFNKKII